MNLGDVVAMSAAKFGQRTALVFDDRRISFVELDDRVRRLAGAMSRLAARGDRIAILSQNRPEYVEAYFGVPLAGMALTFLNYRLAPRELARIIVDADASVLLVEDAYLETLAAMRDEIPCVSTVVAFGNDLPPDVITYESLLAGEPIGAVETPTTDEHDLAWLIYTSGTTGMPKGAMLTHRSVLAGVQNFMMHSGARIGEDVSLMSFPLCHIAGMGVVSAAASGTTLVLRRSFEPGDTLRTIVRERVTVTSLAPTMISMFLAHPDNAQTDLSSLRQMAYGGSSMPVQLLRQAMARLPQVDFVSAFGMTELSGHCTYFSAEAHRLAAAERPEILASAGRVMAFNQFRLVDDAMQDVPLGEPGEIVVRGDNVMSGYWRRPDANVEAFAGGWFHSGDMARMDADGYTYIVDRKKDMIITGGENVYSREVEEVIHAIDGVFEVSVIGLPDPHWGENVCAVVVRDPGATVTEQEIIDVCRRDLAGYKKPKSVVFVDEIPHNASGKALKRELRVRFAPV